MYVLRLTGQALMGGAMSVGATALVALPSWFLLQVLLPELAARVPLFGMEGLVVLMTALPISFCCGAVLAAGAALSSRWPADALPWRPLAFAAAAVSLVIAAVWVDL